MKRYTIVIIITVFTNLCFSQEKSKIFFNDSNNNSVKKIDHYKDKIYILGKKDIKNDNSSSCNTLLCLNNELYRSFSIISTENELFEDIVIDYKGNAFLIGHDNENCILIKINDRFKFKKIIFKDYDKFTEIIKFKKNLLIVASKHEVSLGLPVDMTYILFVNTKGQVVRKIKTTQNIGKKNICVSDEKIFLILNKYDPKNDKNTQPIICCYNLDGEKLWEKIITNEETGVDWKINIINVKESLSGIYVLCISKSNTLNETFLIFHININGEIIEKTVKDLETIRNEISDNYDDLLMIPTKSDIKNSNSVRLTTVVKINSENQLYFRTIRTDFELVDFFQNKKYIFLIGNFYKKNNKRAWKIYKYEKFNY